LSINFGLCSIHTRLNKEIIHGILPSSGTEPSPYSIVARILRNFLSSEISKLPSSPEILSQRLFHIDVLIFSIYGARSHNPRA